MHKSSLSNTGYITASLVGILTDNEDISKEILYYIAKRCGFDNMYLHEKYDRLIQISERSHRNLSTAEKGILMSRLLTSSIATPIIFDYKRRKLQINYLTISASEISQFVFCPVSLSIQKSFHLLPTKSKMDGRGLHEQLKLINRFDSQNKCIQSFDDESYIHGQNEQFLKEINNSKLIYAGHDKKHNVPFQKNDFVGQPDYIFQNQNDTFFVVEEKFRYAGRELNDETSIHYNHLMQTAAYIYGIKEYNIEYGYVVQWLYDTDYEENIVISDLIVDKITKSDKIRNNLTSVYINIREFYNSKSIHFDNASLNLNKCLHCSVAGICSHKYGKNSVIALPYKINYQNNDTPVPREIQHLVGYIDLLLNHYFKCYLCKRNYHILELSSICMKYLKTEYNNNLVVDEYEIIHIPNIDVSNVHEWYPAPIDYQGDWADNIPLFTVPYACKNCSSQPYYKFGYS